MSRLFTLKGVGHVSGNLAERRGTEAAAFARSELAVLSQLVRAPYIDVKVARIAPEDMPIEKADTHRRRCGLICRLAPTESLSTAI